MRRRRISHRRFDHQMDRLQGASDLFDEQLEKAREQVAIVADHARKGVRRGRKAVITLEQAVARAAREHPIFFLLAAVGLLALLLAIRQKLRRKESPSETQSRAENRRRSPDVQVPL